MAKSEKNHKSVKKTVKKSFFKRIKIPRRILCDCMSVLCGVILLGSLSASFILYRQTTANQVLGVSQQLNTEVILQDINLERAKLGLGPVSQNDKLAQAAHNKGENMFQESYWAHISPEGTQPWQFISEADYDYQSAGENLARDFNTESALVAAWLASPTHRANMLNPHFSEAGLAVLEGIIDNQNVLLVVNLFAQPRLDTGIIAQTSVYDRSSDSLVLAGTVMPEGQLLGRDWTITPLQLTFVSVVLLGVVLTLQRLRRAAPSRRLRKKMLR